MHCGDKFTMLLVQPTGATSSSSNRTASVQSQSLNSYSDNAFDKLRADQLILAQVPGT